MMMTLKKILTGAALGLVLATAGCGEKSKEAAAQPEAAKQAAGAATIAAGLGDAAKFEAAAKATGLTETLAGPGPYTVLVPSDAAFEKLPAGALDQLMKPDARTELTGVLTYHILPGVMLSEDIAKGIEAGKGKVLLPTMGGGTLTATMDGNAIVVTDGSGTKAKFVGNDEKRSNGVIHRIDAVMMPS
jgi:uncharacterized surface protein with fasciclin (FAS1) repeats